MTSPDPTQEDIELVARERTKQQTNTADISYKLEHAELAITNDGKFCFFDTDVHDVIYSLWISNVNLKILKNSRSEWF